MCSGRFILVAARGTKQRPSPPTTGHVGPGTERRAAAPVSLRSGRTLPLQVDEQPAGAQGLAGGER